MGKSSIKSDIKPKGELYLPPKGYPPINRGRDIPPIREEYNKSPYMQREGPLDILPRGTYKGRKVEDIIRSNPRYFMTCVKEWLDISPSQSTLFTLVTGGEIPSRYIKEDPPKVEDWTERDYRLYYSNQDILPNHDFEDDPPEWWEEFKRKSSGMTRPSQVVDLYRGYIKRDLQSILKEL